MGVALGLGFNGTVTPDWAGAAILDESVVSAVHVEWASSTPTVRWEAAAGAAAGTASTTVTVVAAFGGDVVHRQFTATIGADGAGSSQPLATTVAPNMMHRRPAAAPTSGGASFGKENGAGATRVAVGLAAAAAAAQCVL